jgi:hypothetical protein
MDDNSFYLYFGIWVVFIFVGYFLGQTKGNGPAGAFMGAIFGPIGWLLALIVSPEAKACPFCVTRIPFAAIVCPQCGRDIPPPVK